MKLIILLTLIVVIACVAATDDKPRFKCRKSRGLVTAPANRRVCEWKCPRRAGEAAVRKCERPKQARCVCNPDAELCRNSKGKCEKKTGLKGSYGHPPS